VFIESAKTGASKMSLRSQVLQTIKEEGTKHDWDPSVKSENKMTTEDRVAARLATEVLKENTKLRGIHSHSSIKRLLEKEAKRQLLDGGEYKPPIVSTIKEKEL
jgi:hypothetical protein